MAAMTRLWTPVSRSPCAARNASPWRRKISATSSAGRTGRSRGRDHHEGKAVEGARRAGDQGCGDLGVPSRRRQLDMPEQNLNDPDVGPALQKMSGETVPERVGRDGLIDPRPSPRSPAGGLQGAGADRCAGLLAWKQPQTGPRPPPVGAQNAEQAWRQHRITVSAAFSVFDVDQHPRAVDGGDLQARNLADPQSRRIGRRQRDTVAQARNRFQKTDELLGIEHRRKLLGLPAADDPRDGFRLPERDAVEEAQGARDLVDVRPRALLGNQMELVGADLLRAELSRRQAEMTAELRNGVEIGLL